MPPAYPAPFTDRIEPGCIEGHTVVTADDAHRGTGPCFDAGHDDVVIVKAVKTPAKVRQGLCQGRRNKIRQDVMQIGPGHAGAIGMDGAFGSSTGTLQERTDGLSRCMVVAPADLIASSS